MKEIKQFNPKPGDKIICMNGEEYTCCTLEQVRELISEDANSDKPIIGYYSESDYSGWQDWDRDGVADVDYPQYKIVEVVPVKKEEIQLELTCKAAIVELPLFTPEDIRKAVIDDLGWLGHSFDLLMDSLKKVKNPEYMEYLRLKAMFETEEE